MEKYQQDAQTSNLFSQLSTLDGRIEMIQMLILLGLEAVAEMLLSQVEELVGPKHQRSGSLKRWGYNQGSVFLGEQKLPVKVPGVPTSRPSVRSSWRPTRSSSKRVSSIRLA